MTPTFSVTRALLSVSDKTGLLPFAQGLAGLGVTLVSTGGTARALEDAGLAVTSVSDVTDWPEMLGGRVKTLHPRIHGGLLARRNEAGDRADMETHEIPAIDLLAVNLYPFEETVAAGASVQTAIENIDIGGPAMIRAAAKNAAHVAVVVDPEDYGSVLDALRDRNLDLDMRRRLAAKAFARTAAYDSVVSSWHAARFAAEAPLKWRGFGGESTSALRYGENPHQTAAFYRDLTGGRSVASASLLQGKPLSYNNLNDADAAFELASEFAEDGPAAVIIKHANPCGVAQGASLAEAYQAAKACDPVSAFGGVVAFNGTVDRVAAEAVTAIFAEVVIAPQISSEARQIFASKANLRVLETGGMADPKARRETVRSLRGGLLVQEADSAAISASDWTVVTRRAPDARETSDLLMAFKVAKHVKSNAIVYVKDGATAGVGAGQMSRVDSARIAARKAEDAAAAAGWSEARTRGSVAASDAFFPFPDGLEALSEAGATAVIQPGGSIRDADVIAAADARGLAMVFTGLRTFRH